MAMIQFLNFHKIGFLASQRFRRKFPGLPLPFRLGKASLPMTDDVKIITSIKEILKNVVGFYIPCRELPDTRV
jgi:hypothetical protein